MVKITEFKDELYWNSEAYAFLLLSINNTITVRLEKLKTIKQDSTTSKLIRYMEKVLQYRNKVSKEILPLLDKFYPLKQFFEYLAKSNECFAERNDEKAGQNNSESFNDLIFSLMLMCFMENQCDNEPINNKIVDFLKEYKDDIIDGDSNEYGLYSLDGIIKLLNDMDVSGEEKLLFINFYIDRENLYNMICKLRDEICLVCKKYYYIVEEEHKEYYKHITTEINILDKIGKYFSFDFSLEGDTELYISVGFYNSLTLRNINKKYVYFLGLCLFDMIEAKDNNMNDVIVSDLKVLSDATRYKIIQALMKKEMYLQEIATELSLTPATISHHINLLLNSGYLSVKVNTDISKRIYYGVNKAKIESIIEILHELIS